MKPKDLARPTTDSHKIPRPRARAASAAQRDVAPGTRGFLLCFVRAHRTPRESEDDATREADELSDGLTDKRRLDRRILI